VVAHLVVDCTLDAGLWFVFFFPSGSWWIVFQNLFKKKRKKIPRFQYFLYYFYMRIAINWSYGSKATQSSPLLIFIRQCCSDFRLHTTTVVTKCSQRSTNQNVC
jgi:hypothetical protein